MKLLLDTHAILWWVNEYEKLSFEAKSMLLKEENELFLSIVSAWEIAIKTSLKKLTGFNGGARKFLANVEELPIHLLPVKPRHIEIVGALPFVHRDPFDRMIVAAA
jgi:PIN domain nuclease of toxin-antitoxin system